MDGWSRTTTGRAYQVEAAFEQLRLRSRVFVAGERWNATCQLHDMSFARHRPQRLLVATDLSQSGGHALSRALLLPIARDAEIALLHVASPRHMRSLSRERLRTLFTELGAMQRGWRGRAVIEEVVRGTPEVEIVRRAHTFDADIILMGRHGKRRFADPFVGTTAARVVRTASCPVLLVARAPEADYRVPLLASDLAASSHRLVRLAASVVAANVQLRVVHVVPPGEIRMTAPPPELSAAATRLEHFVDAERRRIGIMSRIRVGNVATSVLEEATSVGADLLIVGTYADSAMARALTRTSNDSVLANASCDLLVGAPVRRLHHDLGQARPST